MNLDEKILKNNVFSVSTFVNKNEFLKNKMSFDECMYIYEFILTLCEF
jgi:hypothetical protein